MIQAETKISINEQGPYKPTPHQLSSTTSLPPTSAPSAAAASSNSEKLRCPRCDSSNTKFCYYNNYNLTQPRHFCKTCRRYWTKGGTLRNVPIGGGCRKNRTPAGSANKMKGVVASGLDRGLPPSPILFGSPQNSHLLALLRANQNPNIDPMLSSDDMLNPIALSYDHGVALCNNNYSLWIKNQELSHKIWSSSSVNSSSSSSSSSSLSNLLGSSSSVSRSEFGCFNNPTFSWSDLP